jgi:hypothetical protein
MPDFNKPSRFNKNFRTESGMVRYFLQCIRETRSPWGPLEIAQEWNYESGITDVLTRSADGALIAFEAKLKDWRKACLQGYRNSGFADLVYIVLPEVVAYRVRENASYFARHQVGLCVCTSIAVEIVIPAPRNEPVMTWIRNRAASEFEGAKDGVRSRSHWSSRADLRGAEC